jgi:hypothetical protein
MNSRDSAPDRPEMNDRESVDRIEVARQHTSRAPYQLPHPSPGFTASSVANSSSTVEFITVVQPHSFALTPHPPLPLRK